VTDFSKSFAIAILKKIKKDNNSKLIVLRNIIFIRYNLAYNSEFFFVKVYIIKIKH
jgi:hypothetical protein